MRERDGKTLREITFLLRAVVHDNIVDIYNQCKHDLYRESSNRDSLLRSNNASRISVYFERRRDDAPRVLRQEESERERLATRLVEFLELYIVLLFFILFYPDDFSPSATSPD